MSKKRLRLAILGAVVLALGATLVLSPDAMAGPSSCCCGDGSCPTDDLLEFDTSRCCESREPAPSPLAEAGESSPPAPDDARRSAENAFVTTATPAEFGSTPESPHGPPPPGVALHTLHSIFLI